MLAGLSSTAFQVVNLLTEDVKCEGEILSDCALKDLCKDKTCSSVFLLNVRQITCKYSPKFKSVWVFCYRTSNF